MQGRIHVGIEVYSFLSELRIYVRVFELLDRDDLIPHSTEASQLTR